VSKSAVKPRVSCRKIIKFNFEELLVDNLRCPICDMEGCNSNERGTQ